MYMLEDYKHYLFKCIGICKLYFVNHIAILNFCLMFCTCTVKYLSLLIIIFIKIAYDKYLFVK
jgi:hypothetical protein